MSLETAAKHLASQGRGPDTQLVHMSLGELNSLQELAKAHGGTLSINPDTGLPEAGFLSSILPMVIGAGLTAATGGAFSPMMLGLGVGGVQALRTGDLGKGLMAGLGAYGGAGLAGSFMNAGTGALSQAAGTAGASAVTPVTAGANLTQGAADIGNVYAQEQAAQNAIANKLAATTPMETAKAGVGQIVKNPSQLFTKGNLGYGLAAAAPAFSAEPKTEMPKLDSEPAKFSYSPGRVPDPMAGYPADYQGEYAYFRPSYTRLAAGGPVEAMSDANAVGANTGYPMANISRGAYATPYQQPIPQNVVTGPQDTRVDAFTGAERFADGGSTDEYRYEYDPVRQAYKQILPPTTAAGINSTSSGDMRGDGGGSFSSGVSSSGRETGLNPFSAIAAGEAIQGFGRGLGGFMPGGMLANAIGGGLVGYGQNAISQNQAALDAEMGAAMNAAQNAAANEAGISAAFGNADSTYGGADVGASTGTDYGSDGFGNYATGGITALAYGGQSHLGDYSDGGRLLRGPGDGVSDSIPATIGNKRPARLADGEFVVPARIVSELGNGSTEAGARKLYAMMNRVQAARGKTTGKGKVAKNTRAEKYLPA